MKKKLIKFKRNSYKSREKKTKLNSIKSERKQKHNEIQFN